MNRYIKTLFFLATMVVLPALRAQEKTIIRLENKPDAPIISKHIYGHFAEHLGRSIYGGIFVGEDSPIPNTRGVRNDIIQALKDIKIPNLRWPGGCFADTYHWKDGVGPKEDRPSIVNQWWGGVTEDNSFGTHDFLNLAEELGAEPYLAANVGSGTVEEFTDWIQYVNHPEGSPMAKWRKENGREEPWNVKYWGVGNEMWGCGGHMTPEYYANVYRKYATFMTDWSNTSNLYRIASGANQDDYHWTEVLMRDIPKHLIDGVALHSYSYVDWENKGSATEFDEAQYFSTLKTALWMQELIDKHTAIMDKYDPEKEIDLIVDEWGAWYEVEEGTNPGFLYQQNTMRDAMIAGVSLNIFNNESERVKMANLAQTVNVLQAVALTDGEKMLLTPTYYVLKMYTVHHDAQLLPVEFDSPQYTYNGESLPAISISASRNDQDHVNISLVNIDSEKEHKVELDLEELDVEKMKASILTSENLQDHNTFDTPENIVPVDFEDFKLDDGEIEITLPPYSVIVLEEI
jgi:alpha-N-arabinofuranosidase